MIFMDSTTEPGQPWVMMSGSAAGSGERTCDLPDMTVAASGDWTADIRAAMDELRAMMLRHHWFPGLFPTRPSIGPKALRFWAGLIDVLTRAGLSGADLDNAFCMVGDYVIGTTAIEVTFDRWLAADPEGVAATRAYVSEAAAAYPSYARCVDDYVTRIDAAVRRDRRYEFALECMLDGLATRLPKKRRRKSQTAPHA
jgi:Tetracyclin repressor-like, C-terminal domain